MSFNKDKIIRELAEVINRNSLENYSNTPDFILAEYLYYCWEAFNWASNRRETWYGIRMGIGTTIITDKEGEK